MTEGRGVSVDKDLLGSAKRGRRFNDILDELPLKKQLDLARKAGMPFPKGSVNQAREATTARPRILAAINARPLAGADVLLA